MIPTKEIDMKEYLCLNQHINTLTLHYEVARHKTLIMLNLEVTESRH